MAHDAYSALSDPTRRRILWELREGARPVGELVETLGISQPTVSKHLKVLRDAQLVASRADGQKRFYSVEAAPLESVVEWVRDITSAVEDALHSNETAPGEAPESPAADAALPAADDAVAPVVDDAVQADDVAAPATGVEPEISPEPAGVLTPEAAREAPWHGGSEPEVPVFDVISEDTPAAVQVTEKDTHALLGDADHSADVEKGVSETPVTRAKISDNTDVNPAATEQDTHVLDQQEPAKPVYGVPNSRSGSAQRRQGGLLSTLAGFGRRGRGPRH